MELPSFLDLPTILGLDWQGFVNDELGGFPRSQAARLHSAHPLDPAHLSMPDWRGELGGLTFRIMRNLPRLPKHSAILHHKIYFFQRIQVDQRIA
jgi:hypothetical protein